MYTTLLLCTDNIKALTLNTGTVKPYLFVDTTLIRSAAIIKCIEYFDPQYNKFHTKSPDLERVLQRHKRWEAMPCIHELVTIFMLLYMVNNCSNNPDSFKSAHFDWQVLSHYIGL